MEAKKIVYIIGTYPLLTTTFIDREIKRLYQSGIALQIFSIRRPARKSPLSAFQVQQQRVVTYLLPVNRLRFLLSHLFFAVTAPIKYFGSLIYLLSRPHPNFAARFKTLLHFGEGVYFAYFLRKQKIHEVHAHFLDRAAVLALIAKRLLGVPYSISIHAGADIYVNPALIREKLEEARHAVTCTQYNKKHLESLVGNSLTEKITYIPHGLDTSDYTAGKNHSGKLRILSVGQLRKRKGFLQLVDVCKMLNDDGFDFQCEIIGEGLLHETLQEKITELSLDDKVFLRGAIPHEEVLEKYRQATLFVMPCIITKEGDVDGIPNVLIEAMAMEIPVISTTVSAIPELIDDQKNGLLVSPNNLAELFDAIVALYNAPERRAELGREGRQTVMSDYDIEKNIDRFIRTLWPELIN